MTYATGMVRKIDNGYRGLFENESERGLFHKGDAIFNRQFHPFPKGSLLRVRIYFSPKGRKMVKEVVLVAGPEDVDPTVKELESPKPVEELEEMTTPEIVESVEEKKEKEAPVAEPESGKVLPKAITHGYYVGPEERLTFNTALGMSSRNPEKAVKIMMVGPSGYGKTTLPKLFAEVSGKDFLRMNCATVRDPEEWFGYREARDGSTVFVRSHFAKVLEAGNVVVVLDEFNRLEPWLHNTLFPLLDEDGATVVHDEEFRIGPGVIVVGTINIGYRFTGTFELDEALMNRFEFVLEVGPLPHDEEVKVLVQRTGVDVNTASLTVKVANILRQNDVACSTRTTLLISNMVTAGLFLREAFETAVVKRIPVDSSGSALRKHVVDLINVELGPVEGRMVSGDIFGVGNEEDAPVVEKRHKLTLFLEDASAIQILKLVKLIRGLDVVGPRLSLSKSNSIAQDIFAGETVVLELNGDPGSLSEFSTVGVTARYSSVLA